MTTIITKERAIKIINGEDQHYSELLILKIAEIIKKNVEQGCLSFILDIPILNIIIDNSTLDEGDYFLGDLPNFNIVPTPIQNKICTLVNDAGWDTCFNVRNISTFMNSYRNISIKLF